MIAVNSEGMGGHCGEGSLAEKTTTHTPLANDRGKGAHLGEVVRVLGKRG